MSCQSGVCVFESCARGWVDCDQDPSNGCEVGGLGGPSTPVLRSPMIGAYTGSVHAERSRMPKFTWQPGSDRDACLHVPFQIQIDDSCDRSDYANCEFPSPEVDQSQIASTSFSPPSPLPVRAEVPVGTRYYWRVRACPAPSHCSLWTPTRYLNVGRLMNDLNGDGYSDTIAVSRYPAGSYYRHYPQIVTGGPAAGYTLGPAFSSAVSDNLVGYVRFVGDINGDGYADALHTSGSSQGLYLGARDVTTIGPRPLPRTASWTDGDALGDWNGDGYDDFVIGYQPNQAAMGSAKVYEGGPELDDAPDLELAPRAGTSEEWFGASVAGAVDMDGDGYSELAVLNGEDGAVDIVHGGVAPDPDARTLLPGPQTCHEGFVARAGDLNADGFGELAVRCGKHLSVFAGNRVLETLPIWTTALTGEVDIGRELIGGFDLGDDGIDDLLFQDLDRWLLVLPGSTALGTDSPIHRIVPGLGNENPPIPRGLSAGDCDGDGRPDLLVARYPRLLDVFSGSAAATNTATCLQPSSSYPQIGNWCNLSGVQLNAGTEVVSFGEVLAY